LEHGDFFGGNIIVQNGMPIIYDWSDCTLSHPFLSATVYLEEVEELFSYEFAESLLDDYVSEWTTFDSKDRLHEEYRLLQLIAPIFYLSVYQSFIFPAFKDNWDKRSIIEYYIEKWISTFESF
jgi:aminoglycoside phosphotransferase (APT) family kinase protein